MAHISGYESIDPRRASSTGAVVVEPAHGGVSSERGRIRAEIEARGREPRREVHLRVGSRARGAVHGDEERGVLEGREGRGAELLEERVPRARASTDRVFDEKSQPRP